MDTERHTGNTFEKDAEWNDQEIERYLMMKASELERYYVMNVLKEEGSLMDQPPMGSGSNEKDYSYLTEGQSLRDLDDDDPWFL